MTTEDAKFLKDKGIDVKKCFIKKVSNDNIIVYVDKRNVANGKGKTINKIKKEIS